MNNILDDLKKLNSEAKKIALDGKVDEAINVFEGICHIDPNFYNPHFNLGILYFGQNKIEESKKHYYKALEIVKNDKNSVINLVHILKDNGESSDAKFILENYIKENNNDAEILRLYNFLLENTEIEFVKAERKLNVLFVQSPPCIRNYKYAKALKARGHSITLLYDKMDIAQRYKGLSNDVYKEVIKLKNYNHLWELSKNYDIVHCHNEPDILSVVAMTGITPVIHDTHDLISLRIVNDSNTAFFEALANRGCAGRVYTTIYQLEKAKSMYAVSGDSIVFGNYASASDLPSNFLPKLSSNDGNIHIVYQGGISNVKHRDFLAIFTDITNFGFHIHIYPAKYDENIKDLFADNHKLHYYHPISPNKLIEEMTQYDVGIIPWNLEKGNKEFLDTTIANKLYEYFGANLPVITSPVQSYVDFFKENKAGFTFENGQNLFSKKEYLLELIRNTDFRKHVKTYEDEILKLENFYYKIIDNWKK